MLGPETRKACKTLGIASGEKTGSKVFRHTKQEFILINHISHTEIESAKYHDERLRNAIKQCDDEDEDGLGVNDAIVDHRGSVKFCVI